MLLFAPTYETTTFTDWKGIQATSGRVTLVPTLGSADDPYKPVGGNVLRCELQVNDSAPSGGHRAEIYGRSPSPWSTPAAQWPDPEGVERWLAFSMLIDPAFKPSAPWLVLSQLCKGYRGGSPTLSIEVDRSELKLGGNITRSIGAITPGRWTRLMIGRFNSPDPALGWVQVFRNGLEVVPKTPCATMDTDAQGTDPTYLKMGPYASWSRPDVALAYYGPPRLGTIPAEVQ
jgi:hypothetical protein